jgi:2-C-methyl-D-erythritol 2,4-cyclodiphosphate synthase
VRDAGYTIGNIDTNIVAQRPKLNPHIDAMRQNLADCLEIDLGAISVKAKTNETVGPEGRGEAISTQAVVLLVSG